MEHWHQNGSSPKKLNNWTSNILQVTQTIPHISNCFLYNNTPLQAFLFHIVLCNIFHPMLTLHSAISLIFCLYIYLSVKLFPCQTHLFQWWLLFSHEDKVLFVRWDMKYHQNNRSIAIYISCTTTTSQGSKGQVPRLYEKPGLTLACCKKSQSGLNFQKVLHTSVELGLQNRNC